MGFCGVNTTNENYSMVCGCFTKVDDAKQYSLYDLKVNGYDPSHPQEPAKIVYTGGCGKGQFELMVLQEDGNPYPNKTFYWLDCLTGLVSAPKPYPAGWYTYDSDNNDYVRMDDEVTKEIKFDLGQAFWIAGSGYNLVSAGAVSPQRLEFQTNKENYTPVGNGMPVDCTLGDLYVNGYDPSHPQEPAKIVYTGGCGKGQFELMILKNDGNPDKTFYYLDCLTGLVSAPKPYPAGWYTYDSENNDYIPVTDADKALKITAGQGFWVAGSKYNLVVPSPLVEKKDAE